MMTCQSKQPGLHKITSLFNCDRLLLFKGVKLTILQNLKDKVCFFSLTHYLTTQNL